MLVLLVLSIINWLFNIIGLNSGGNMKQKYIRLIFLAFDLVFLFLFSLAFCVVSFGFSAVFASFTVPLIYSICISILTVLTFVALNVYRIVTSEIGFFDAIKISIICLAIQVVGFVVLTCIMYKSIPNFGIYTLGWILNAIGVSLVVPSARFAVRLFNSAHLFRKNKTYFRTLIIGAGASGKVAIDEINRNKKIKSKVVAFVDDDVNKIGGSLSNIPVKGPIKDIAKIIDFYKANEVIIAISDISKDRLDEIIELLESCPVKIRRMPLLSEMSGPHEKKILDIDINDLLNREPIKLDNSKIAEMLFDKTVLVTGAGGTIGSELVRQIFKTKPKRIVLFDIYENSTYQIQMELARIERTHAEYKTEIIALIGSTYNRFRVEEIINKYRPDYVYHAAAYKHVPLMEDSPAEAIRTNVIGTYNVASLCNEYCVKKMILVSTDKAVRPTSTMGATKRFAELIIQHFASVSNNTVYAAVRFGNVLGSNGSVVPLFKKQIEEGGPLTLTHKDIIRYFMTIPEAVSLILQCGLFAKKGEIFILDMGKPVKIKQLAERMIRQAGLIPYVDINIVETGLRPGEKLYEELLLDKDKQEKTANSRIFIEEKGKKVDDIESDIKNVSKAFEMTDKSEIKELLKSFITTYTITENSHE